MQESIATIEFINDCRGSIYAHTKDGPFLVDEPVGETLENGQRVKVRYDLQDQYATIIQTKDVE